LLACAEEMPIFSFRLGNGERERGKAVASLGKWGKGGKRAFAHAILSSRWREKKERGKKKNFVKSQGRLKRGKRKNISTLVSHANSYLLPLPFHKKL